MSVLHMMAALIKTNHVFLLMAVGILGSHLQIVHLSALLDGQNKASEVNTPPNTAKQVIHSNL